MISAAASTTSGARGGGPSVRPLPSALTTAFATVTRANHLYSAATKCQGAAAVEVRANGFDGRPRGGIELRSGLFRPRSLLLERGLEHFGRCLRSFCEACFQFFSPCAFLFEARFQRFDVGVGARNHFIERCSQAGFPRIDV